MKSDMSLSGLCGQHSLLCWTILMEEDSLREARLIRLTHVFIFNLFTLLYFPLWNLQFVSVILFFNSLLHKSKLFS